MITNLMKEYTKRQIKREQDELIEFMQVNKCKPADVEIVTKQYEFPIKTEFRLKPQPKNLIEKLQRWWFNRKLKKYIDKLLKESK